MKSLYIIAASLLVSTSAFATGKHEPKPTTPPVTTPAPQTQNQGQAQGQLQGQFQNSSSTANAQGVGFGGNGGLGLGGAGGNATGGKGGRANASATGGTSQATGGNAVGYGGDAASEQRNRQTTTVNANTYQARQRNNTPGVSLAPSALGSGSPCEGLPFGIGGSAPGLSAMFQIPRESDRCWGERGVTQAMVLRQQGIRISENAILAIYAGVPARQAILDNPYVETRSYAPRRAYRAKAKARPCVPCGR